MIFVQTFLKATTTVLVTEENDFFFRKRCWAQKCQASRTKALQQCCAEIKAIIYFRMSTEVKYHTQPPAEIEIFPFDCGQETCAYPFYESNISMKKNNFSCMWSEWQLAEAMVLWREELYRKSLKVQFHHSKCYLMISLLL